MEIYRKIKTSIKDALLNEHFMAKAEQNAADIAYLAMMTGIEIKSEEDNEDVKEV